MVMLPANSKNRICNPYTYEATTQCISSNIGMNNEIYYEKSDICAAFGNYYLTTVETTYCPDKCNEEANRCEPAPTYHIDDPCNPDEFWIRCQDETHRFVCTDNKIASEECPSEQKCKNNIYYGGYSNSTCVNESDL